MKRKHFIAVIAAVILAIVIVIDSGVVTAIDSKGIHFGSLTTHFWWWVIIIGYVTVIVLLTV